MEYVVMGLLILQSFTLYELNQAFKQGISMFYSASFGSLQAAVKGLLGKGWVVFEERVENGRNKKVYSITEKGRAAFHEWMLDEIPANKLEVTVLSKVYFLGLVQSVEHRKHILLEILNKIQQANNELDQMNAAISHYQVPAAFENIYKYQMKTLEYGLRSHAVAREWASELLEDLEKENR